MKLINLIKEFLRFKSIVDSFSPLELSEDIKEEIRIRWDETFEKKVNDVLIMMLIKQMIKNDLSKDYVNWYRDWLIMRANIMKKKLDKNNVF